MSQSALHTLQDEARAHWETLHDWRVAAHYGDVAAEYATLTSGSALIDLSLRAKWRLHGDDRVRFLQNMLTNDVAALAPGEGCRAAKLDVKGKWEVGLNVCVDRDLVWCDLQPGGADAVFQQLRKRIIFDKAEIEDVTRGWNVLCLQGPASAELLRACGVDVTALATELRHVPASLAEQSVRIVRNDHSGEGGFDVWCTTSGAPAVARRLLDARIERPTGWVGLEALDRRRIEAGIPWQGSELTPERFPQEAGLDDGWISYTKGCYLGQETISRIHHMGHVNRYLRGVVVEARCDRGDTLELGGKSVGVTTSVTRSGRLDRWIALAYVRRDHAEPGTRLICVAQGDQRVDAVVHALPFF